MYADGILVALSSTGTPEAVEVDDNTAAVLFKVGIKCIELVGEVHVLASEVGLVEVPI